MAVCGVKGAGQKLILWLANQWFIIDSAVGNHGPFYILVQQPGVPHQPRDQQLLHGYQQVGTDHPLLIGVENATSVIY
jgi:hypothetical protein